MAIYRLELLSLLDGLAVNGHVEQQWKLDVEDRIRFGLTSCFVLWDREW